jgi:cysteine desulfurase/selenocysteine lyase
MLGPTGIGALWARRELLEAMPPFLGGGEMIREVKLGGSKWNDVPWKFEAGTMPIAEAVGLGAAVPLIAWMNAVFAHDREPAAYARPACAKWLDRVARPARGEARRWWRSRSPTSIRTTRRRC